MRTRIIPIAVTASFPLAIAIALILIPRLGGAGIAVPTATKAACCTAFDPPPPPPPDGDRDFFAIKGGSPNVMLLLDSSGSMKAFPRELSWRGFNMGTASAVSTQGTCDLPTPFVNDTTTYDINDPKYDVPYDNGYTTTEMTDNPPWGLARCTAKQPRPTTDGARDWCQFRADSYYKVVSGVNLAGSTFWDDTDARTYNTHPCAAADTSGNLIYGYGGALVSADTTACNACLTSKGFYFFKTRYRDSSGNWRDTPEQIAFSGRFMNAFPPKHIIARKVVKDLVKLDVTSASGNDAVRFGLAAFQTSTAGGFQTYFRTGDGGRLLVPLGPSCTDTSGGNRAAYVAARQAIVDAINAIDTTNSTWPSRYFAFNSNTPLAESLFNVGQYFANTGTTGVYTTRFGANWVLPRTGDTRDFRETSAGVVNASWASSGTNRSFCWACQQSSIVVVTDGEPNMDSNLPSGSTTTPHADFNNDFRYWSSPTIDCPACQCDLSYGNTCTLTSPVVPSSGRIPNMLHKVAAFLAQTDLRPDLTNPTSQTVATYTISFGLDPTATAPAGDKKAIATLRKTAELGGGIFSNTSSGEELKAALSVAVNDVVSRQSSFSAGNSNALQTSKTNQVDAYLARFKPTDATIWEGHLFAGMVFDEYGQGCDERFPTSGQRSVACGTKPAVNPNLNGDDRPDGKANCGGAWIVDADCSPIVADNLGNYMKGDFDPVTHKLSASGGAANLAWDAGAVLSDPTKTGYKTAKEGLDNSRKIWTVIDRNSDGRLNGDDGLTEFTADNAAALAPAMGLDQTWCMSLLQRTGYCGASPLPACPAWNDDTRTVCAKQVIYFIRGYDVLDWDNDHCAGPDSYDNTHPWGSCTASTGCGAEASCISGMCVNSNCTAEGEERDRYRDSRALADQQFWKLGDIFHSSPVLVKPPIDKFTCSYGIFELQCVPTLFGGRGWKAQSGSHYPPLARYGTTQDAYDKFRADNLARAMIVLVGANDGMLHAFDAGTALTGSPRTLNGNYQYTAGTGSEQWAFIPPDLLPRLRHSLDSYQYYVDGNTMVRDVWIDANSDGVKQANEFRTVAVMSERGGGSRFTALDVTDPLNPTFMWTFPEGCSELSAAAGQSWSDFLPRAPPVGPVRVSVTTGDPDDIKFEERWIVFLNGGYDPAMIRGRYVAMVDIANGRPIWKFTDLDFKAMRGNTTASMLPVAATIGMSDIGEAVAERGIFDNDGYFDTATWGDMAGNLFVARMHQVGQLDAAGTVRNWFAARTFEQNRRTDDVMNASGRSPFFLMTANMVDYPSRLMTLVGSGNRERLLDQSPKCGPGNILACCQAGCTTATTNLDLSYGTASCAASASFSCSGGVMTFGGAANGLCSGSYACGPATQQITFDSYCGATDQQPTTASFGVDATGAVTVNTPFAIDRVTDVSSLMPTCGPNSPRDCYYGVWAYGIRPEKRFTTQFEARGFEGNRFTNVPYAGCGGIGTCSVVDVTQTVVRASGITGLAAKAGDPGWKYCYGRACPTEGCSETWCDERTVSQPTGLMGCIAWSTFRPTGSTGGGDPCTTSLGTPSAFAYAADFLSGLPSEGCSMFQQSVSGDTVYGRATQKGTFAPPPSPATRGVVGSAGIQVSTLATDDAGSEKKQYGKTRAIVAPLYRVEVPRVVHTCRHVDASTCE